MTELFLLCSLIIGHFVGDFVCQTRYMGNNKGSNVSVLLDHVFVYTCILCLFMLPFIVLHLGALGVLTLIPFFVFNFWLHFATDYCSSKLSKYYWSKGNEYGFWCVIGADQALHMSALVTTGFLFFL